MFCSQGRVVLLFNSIANHKHVLAEIFAHHQLLRQYDRTHLPDHRPLPLAPRTRRRVQKTQTCERPARRTAVVLQQTQNLEDRSPGGQAVVPAAALVIKEDSGDTLICVICHPALLIILQLLNRQPFNSSSQVALQ